MDRFDWRDGERTIHFGRDRAQEAVDLLGGPGFTLLTTPRAAASLPAVAEAAATVHHVPAGRVDEVAAALLDRVEGERLVALGGGRVIDTAKAIAAAQHRGQSPTFHPQHRGQSPALHLQRRGPSPVVQAIPTTLSGAEMTTTHRHAAGVPADTPRVRPAVVVYDPALVASQPVPDLAASALNALGHAFEGPCTRRANPVARLAGDEAARLIARAFGGGEPDRDALALGAMLAGYSIDSAGYGLHHVLSQTVVRVTGIGHGPGNAVMLAHTARALAERFPERFARLRDALGGREPGAVAAAICRLTGATTLRDLGVERERLAECAEQAARRTNDLAQTPPVAAEDEILALYERAY